MAAQTLEAVFFHGDNQERADYTPSGSSPGVGKLVTLGAGRYGAVTSPEGIADGVLGSVATKGVFKVSKDDGAAVTFAVGANVYFNTVTRLAVAADGANIDFIGLCTDKAAAATDNHVNVALNEPPTLATA